MNTSWSIGDGLFGWMVANLPDGAPVLELGSGKGSLRLGLRFRLVSVEHDPEFLRSAANDGVPAVYAPIVDGWYSMPVMSHLVRAFCPTAVLVDGPPAAIGRGGFERVLPELFHGHNVPVLVFDDAHREHDLALAVRCAKAVAGIMAGGVSVGVFQDGPKRFAAVVHDEAVRIPRDHVAETAGRYDARLGSVLRPDWSEGAVSIDRY